jgi:hypothetical protein
LVEKLYSFISFSLGTNNISSPNTTSSTANINNINITSSTATNSNYNNNNFNGRRWSKSPMRKKSIDGFCQCKDGFTWVLGNCTRPQQVGRGKAQ